MQSKTSCPLCGQKDFHQLFVKAGRPFVRCRQDGLVMINPMPTPGEIKRIYEEDYFDWNDRSAAACIGYYQYIAERPLLIEYFQKKIKLLATKGRILDIGCGHGFFLEAAKLEKKQALGIDLSPQAVAYARKHKLEVKLTDLEHAGFAAGSFGAVTAFQLIEHVVDPQEFCRQVQRVLKPGGTLLLVTPNEGGWLRKLMGKHWLSFRHREHLYFFSAKTLTATLKQAGFRKIKAFADETRWYPLRHLLGGVKFYFKWRWLHKLADLTGKLLQLLGLLDVKIPVPLDSLVVVAKK